MSGEGFKYLPVQKSKKQLSKEKKAQASAAAAEKMKAEIAEQKAQEKINDQIKAAARLVAKANYHPTLPVSGQNYVESLIRAVDFSTADYVETISGGTLRRALVHYVFEDRHDKDSDRYVGDIDCWIGGNAHFVDGLWIAGHAYMLGFKDFQIDTPPAAVGKIAALPAQNGVKPDIL